MASSTLIPTFTPIMTAQNILGMFKNKFTWDAANKKSLPDVRNTNTTYTFRIDESTSQTIASKIDEYLKRSNISATNYSLKLEEFEVKDQEEKVRHYTIKCPDRKLSLKSIPEERLPYMLKGSFVLSSSAKGYAINFIPTGFTSYDPYNLTGTAPEMIFVFSTQATKKMEATPKVSTVSRKRKEKATPAPPTIITSDLSYPGNLSQVHDIFAAESLND